MPSQTDCRIASIENVSVICDEICSRCSSAARCLRAAAVSCAPCTARAAWAAKATSASSSSSDGVRPLAGSSTPRMPSTWPSEWCIGTTSMSSGCHAPGVSSRGMSGM